jgi:hypothetical protein
VKGLGAAVALCCVMLSLAACSSDSGGAIDIPTTTSSPTITTTTAPGGATLQGASTTPVSTPRGSATALLTAVRAARQTGFDRVVFEFEKAVPGYRVQYVPKPVHEDASGKEIAIQGNAVLEVHMEPASGADLSGGSLRQTYTGPARVTGDTSQVTEVVKAGDFEAVLTWDIGVRDKVAFKVSTLQSPARLVVDLQSAA